MPVNVFSLLPQELESRLAQFPAFRYRQLLHWLYGRFVFAPEHMTDLPLTLKDYLLENLSFELPQIALEKAAQDQTTKYSLSLTDGENIEMVIIPAPKKRTLCVSSQVGCARKCSFCATGRWGLTRNLSAAEIVGQILIAASICKPERLTNLVFMGMGEPLDNLENVLKTLQIIQANNTLAFSPRRTTVSTCGIPQQIIKLADSGIKTKLALSLNSAINAKRDNLMPINKIHPLEEIKSALKYYLKKSTFRVTLEYILIPDINMGKDDIKALRQFAGDLSCKINFIPYNIVPHLPYRSPTEIELQEFLQQAQSLHQAITLRRSRGAGICGACGQLAGNHQGVTP
ncbi:MAG: rRNA (adenine2503-C2)-methyltransferase [Candidatus Cloacimonadota bacterium]|nr:rRNA (adenine2503-C2)-methyltransferase [Candidatus Cloacimonadota bacterium]